MEMKFTLTNNKGEDMMPELQAFATAVGLDAVAKDRYSVAFLLELFAGLKSDIQNPAKIVHEIRALEGVSPPTRTKPAIPFKHPPLKGLMHKHHLRDGLSAFAKNVQNELAAKGLPDLKQRIDEVQRSGEERFFTPEDAPEIVREVVSLNYIRRGDRGALTGEWIIYVQHNGLNYYLCLTQHDADHEAVRDQIDAICVKEFPFLSSILAPRA